MGHPVPAVRSGSTAAPETRAQVVFLFVRLAVLLASTALYVFGSLADRVALRTASGVSAATVIALTAAGSLLVQRMASPSPRHDSL